MARRHKPEIMQRHAENPNCFWCGVHMVFYKEEIGVKMPDDQTTVDHVYPAGTPERTMYKKKKYPSPFVLCCNKCNNERGNKSFEEFKKIKKGKK